MDGEPVDPGAGLSGVIHSPLGLMIAAFHWVWSWPGIVVTLVGWALVAKGTAHLTLPSLAGRSLDLIDGAQGARRLRLDGLLMLPPAVAIGWIALR